MSRAITARVVRIGNSQGIRIPKPLLEQLGIHELVELTVEDDQLCIRAKKEARAEPISPRPARLRRPTPWHACCDRRSCPCRATGDQRPEDQHIGQSRPDKGRA